MRIDPVKTQKEPTYQAILDALAFTTCYPAFLITADVQEIYMHQFWFTINKKDSTSYRFNIDKKRFTLNMIVFREIFQMCLNLSNQEFDALPLDEEIVSFIKELGHKGDIKSITEVVIDYMYQPWRTFAANINKCLSGKITAVLPNRMTNQQIQDSNAYKTYLAYVTEEEELEPAKKVISSKKPATKRQAAGVRIRDTPSVSVSKKKAPAKVARSKGIKLLSNAALLEEAQLKNSLKRSKRETTIHQADDEEVQKRDDEPQHANDERTNSENQETNYDKEETKDEFVYTPPNYVPTDDETDDESNDVTKEVYERINEELYGDVNIRLTDAEPDNKDKGDKEMTNAETEDKPSETQCH
ncbi:hypothetical protein Tco_0564764 [Tanacetum coccineum]